MNRRISPAVVATLVWLISVVQGQAFLPESLVVRGEGEVRYMGFIRVYDAQLLAPTDAVSVDVLKARRSFCLQLTYSVALTADNFVTAAEQILARQYSPDALKIYRPLIDQLHRSYRDVAKGDRYQLCYDAAVQTTRLVLNDESLVSIVSQEFAILYSGIWLSAEQPLDATLRRRLLADLGEDRS